MKRSDDMKIVKDVKDVKHMKNCGRRSFMSFTFFMPFMIMLIGARPLPHDEFRFVGTVVRLEIARNRFSVKFKEADSTEETVQIAFTPKTEITRDKKRVAKAELKAGVHVVVDALGDDYDSLEAVAVRIVPPPAK